MRNNLVQSNNIQLSVRVDGASCADKSKDSTRLKIEKRSCKIIIFFYRHNVMLCMLSYRAKRKSGGFDKDFIQRIGECGNHTWNNGILSCNFNSTYLNEFKLHTSWNVKCKHLFFAKRCRHAFRKWIQSNTVENQMHKVFMTEGGKQHRRARKFFIRQKKYANNF